MHADFNKRREMPITLRTDFSITSGDEYEQ